MQDLKKYDKYHRGIVKAHDFLNVLMRLGAVFPSPPVNELMQHCILTHDGFVVYKSLQLLAFPPT
jgi:Ca2+-binding EF-hand superfamily protein